MKYTPGHTPGPWIVTDDTDKRAGLHVRAPKIATPSAPCPSVAKINKPRSWDEARASATLIAASPDLADACLFALAAWPQLMAGTISGGTTAAVEDKLRAALERAGLLVPLSSTQEDPSRG